jgi:hypothetical protein
VLLLISIFKALGGGFTLRQCARAVRHFIARELPAASKAAAESPSQQRDEEQHDGNEKDDFCKANGCSRYPAKAKDSGHDCYDQQRDNEAQHVSFSFVDCLTSNSKRRCRFRAVWQVSDLVRVVFRREKQNHENGDERNGGVNLGCGVLNCHRKLSAKSVDNIENGSGLAHKIRCRAGVVLLSLQ